MTKSKSAIILVLIGLFMILWGVGAHLVRWGTKVPELGEVPSPKLSPDSPPPGDPDLIIGSEWRWEQNLMNDGSVVVPAKPEAFSLSFNGDGRVDGKTDCNNFSADYQFGSDGVLTFGPMMSTLMFCEGSQETVFTSAVAAVHSYQLDPADELLLEMAENAGFMVFKKV